MFRSMRLIFVLGSAGVMVFLLLLGVKTQTTANTASSIIKVPDDQPTIQAAVDAAVGGDTILVAGGMYTENLSITRGITLSGGWDGSFTSRIPGDSVINGGLTGRVISITCAISDTLVTVDGFTIMNGDASGLGVPSIPSTASATNLVRSPATRTFDRRSPSEQAAILRIHMAELKARHLYPGGIAAYQGMLDRLEWRTLQAIQSQKRAQEFISGREEQASVGPGSGGGVFSFNASLQLLNNTIIGNVATQNGQGVGGGVFVAAAPPSAVRIAGNRLERNVASNLGSGWGGGLFMTAAPGAVIEENYFIENLASQAGFMEGLGGGFMVYLSPNILVNGNHVERNTASASWTAGGISSGGGMLLDQVDGITVEDNILRENLTTLHGAGGGGGMHLENSNGATVVGNDVIGNWAVMYLVEDTWGGAGGMAVVNVFPISVTENEIVENTAVVFGAPTAANILGGGFYGSTWRYDSSVVLNEFRGNVTCYSHCDRSTLAGGAFISATEDALVERNLFWENVANLLLGSGGHGGGLVLRDTIGSQVLQNHFIGNVGGMFEKGSGGGLVVDSLETLSIDAAIDANLLLDNRASPDVSEGSYGGAGVFTWIEGDLSFTNNLVAGNYASDGGGISMQLVQNPSLVNNTLVDNATSGILIDNSEATLVNNIVVSHTIGVSVTEAATATLRYTYWHANGSDIAGSGTISQTHPVTGTPGFLDPAADDYHLTGFSAAVDAGDPAGVPPAPEHDFDGHTRPHSARVDIGAFEWQGYRKFFPAVYQNWMSLQGWAVGAKVESSDYGVIIHTTNGSQTW